MDGAVIYSYRKGPAFAENLKSAERSASNLGLVYAKAVANIGKAKNDTAFFRPADRSGNQQRDLFRRADHQARRASSCLGGRRDGRQARQLQAVDPLRRETAEIHILHRRADAPTQATTATG